MAQPVSTCRVCGHRALEDILSLGDMPPVNSFLPAPEASARERRFPLALVFCAECTHVQLTQNGLHDLCLLGWSADTIDPDNFLYVLFDPENAEPGVARNLAFFKNAELHGILSWAQESSDRVERERFYKKAQDLIAQAAPWVPIAHGEVVLGARANLTDLKVHPSGNVYFQPVYRR